AEGESLPDSFLQRMELLDSLGFETVERKAVSAENIPEAVAEFEKNVDKCDYATDGLVLLFESCSYAAALGSTAKFPRGALAFKWKDEEALTHLREIEWNTSRTGLINPVAIFDPVELSGSTITRAGLHNVSIIEELKLGEGDEILVYKANMIIPQIKKNLTQSGSAKIPESCPVCGHASELRTLGEGTSLICPNPLCPAQRLRALTHFVSRDAMNIEGLSEERLERLTEAGIIEDYTDIFSMDEEKIAALPGFGEKSAKNLVEAAERAKNASMPGFINSLGIPQVGLAGAKLLCAHFGYDMDRIIHAEKEELLEIEGFGEIIAQNIKEYFADEKNIRLIEKVRKVLHFDIPETNESEKTLSGMSFVVTGDVFEFKNRRELKEKIESLGGKVAGSVSKKTDFLINNDTNSQSGKNKKAKELGIPVISEREFTERFLSE
ncbi:MAG: NAD-dependent DNA ligase LigA, partial [Firmicutes bacterium]|nr:NAD-dependent DNA ligase LigA [Bacillota bacterium]